MTMQSLSIETRRLPLLSSQNALRILASTMRRMGKSFSVFLLLRFCIFWATQRRMDIRALNDLLAGNEKANGMFAVDYFPVLWYVFVKMILEEGIS